VYDVNVYAKMRYEHRREIYISREIETQEKIDIFLHICNDKKQNEILGNWEGDKVLSPFARILTLNSPL
jgi:hypothetical protein